jgi:hypothetical protein
MRTKILFLVLLALFALFAACLDKRSEGDRCNPLESHDECGGTSLVCTQPAACPEAYCCPANASASTSAFCRGDPSVCPTDGGASGDDGGTDAPSDGDATTD